MSKIVVIAKIPCQPGKRDEAVAGLQPIIDHVEGEEGTLTYLLLKDSTDENILWMYEVYADKAAFDIHSGSDAMKSMGHALGGVLAGRPELTFATPLAGKGL